MKIAESKFRQIVKEELESLVKKESTLPTPGYHGKPGFDYSSVVLPPGWHFNSIVLSFENDKLGADISWDSHVGYNGSWVLSSSDGYYQSPVDHPYRGFEEALLS